MKKLISTVLLIAVMLVFVACKNYTLIDTKWEFNYAYIFMSNGEVYEVEIDRWTEDANSVTIQAKDGQVYSVGYHNCMLTKNRWEY